MYKHNIQHSTFNVQSKIPVPEIIGLEPTEDKRKPEGGAAEVACAVILIIHSVHQPVSDRSIDPEPVGDIHFAFDLGGEGKYVIAQYRFPREVRFPDADVSPTEFRTDIIMEQFVGFENIAHP